MRVDYQFPACCHVNGPRCCIVHVCRLCARGDVIDASVDVCVHRRFHLMRRLGDDLDSIANGGVCVVRRWS
jgi:hypothetical protein